jgi:hypothetical protein
VSEDVTTPILFFCTGSITIFKTQSSQIFSNTCPANKHALISFLTVDSNTIYVLDVEQEPLPSGGTQQSLDFS